MTGKEIMGKTNIRIPFLTPPNKKHKSVKDYDRRQNKQAVKRGLKDAEHNKNNNNK